MNPEFERNIWLEMTSRRVILMPIVLGLVFLAAGALDPSSKNIESIGGVARYLYYFIVIIWGTRSAGSAVAHEIREHTWDFQRLSALTPFQILTGKLFGATSYQWYGGLICLVFVAFDILLRQGFAAMLAQLLFLVCTGLFAQSVALFASLLAVHRRAALRRLDVFLFQMAGLIAAIIAVWLWDVSYVSNLIALKTEGKGIEHLTWWSLNFPLQGFYLVSLLIFLGWSLIGNLTLLRGELQVRTSPLPWISFLLFSVAYWSGFAPAYDGQGLTTERLAIAIAVTTGLTYGAILFEHKDPVLYRWLGAELAHGRFLKVFGALQSWMSAVVLLAMLVVYFEFTFEPPLKEIFGFTRGLAPAVLAGFFFVLRDIGVFLYFNMGTKRGDFGALVALAILYSVLPAMLGGFSGSMLGLFVPNPEANPILMVGAPLIEAAVIWLLAVSRLRQLMKRPA